MAIVGMEYNTIASKERNWGYFKSFVFGGVLSILGLLLEVSSVNVPKIPSFPFNLYIGLLYINLLLVGFLYFRKHMVIKWLISIPASISAICFYTFWVLLMGFVPQEESLSSLINHLNLNNLLSSWPFHLTQFFLLTTLGLVTLKRTIPFKWSNWGFILNHFGLWLIIFSVALGTGDFKRLKMIVFEGQTVMTAFDEAGNAFNMPFALELMDFQMEEYPPKVLLVDKNSSKILASSFVGINDGDFKLADWNLKIVRHQTSADSLNAASFNFKITATRGSTSVEESLPIHNKPSLLQLTNDESLALMPAEPKKYISKVNLNNGTKIMEQQILVNKPAVFAGWKIYQVNYDQNAGKNSKFSVFEVIKDPWLPLVYVGIFMLLVGAFYLIWSGNKKVKIHGVE